MNSQAVGAPAAQLGTELRELVEAGFGGVEVVAVSPIAAELLRVRERHALRPVVDGLPLRPARPRQALAQIADGGVTQLDAEVRDVARHARHPTYPLSARPPARRAAQAPARCSAGYPPRGHSPRQIRS